MQAVSREDLEGEEPTPTKADTAALDDYLNATATPTPTKAVLCGSNT